jgi:hypothetical protein
MLYADRTLQIKTALSTRPDLIETIHTIFEDHLNHRYTGKEVGNGSSRTAYEVGVCEIEDGKNIHLLLKLNPVQYMKYSDAVRHWIGTELSKFGAFETYYDFAAGLITSLSFRSKRGWEECCERGSHLFPQTFSLNDEWGGTRVGLGDLGAVPYFQIAVRYHRKWFGSLTEGLPPLIEPNGSATCRWARDENTVEDCRIIDLGRSHCTLIEIDRGGSLGSLTERYPGNLGIRARGQKYFSPQYRLDVE